MSADASKNVADPVDVTYGGEGATMTVYVYDENRRFVTVSRLSLGTQQIKSMLDKIDQRRRELTVETEPLW